jgi:hypothetical protein
MPRKAPNEVIEHRITFGDFERKELKETLDQIDAFKRTQQIHQAVTNGAYIVGAGAIAWLGYNTWLAVSDIFTGDEVGKNQTGGYLWDTIKLRAGAMSVEEYQQSIANRREEEKEKGGGGFWKWFIGGSDEKFFFFDL